MKVVLIDSGCSGLEVEGIHFFYKIPNRKAYMSYDYNHNNLILGYYDTEKQEYKILGYNSIGKLCCSTISYET